MSFGVKGGRFFWKDLHCFVIWMGDNIKYVLFLDVHLHHIDEAHFGECHISERDW